MADRDAAPPQMDATITAEALPLPPSGHVVDAVGIDLSSGAGTDAGHDGADGRGSGSGRGTGAGAGEGDGVARYQRAKWLSRPTGSAFDRVWPTRQVNGKNVRQIGWAYLACRVKSNGQPHDCQTLYEKPASIGMGAAAISVAAQSRVRPVFRNGAALSDLRVLIPIIFGHERINLPRVSAEASAPRAR